MNKNAELAKKIADKCKALGWTFVVDNNLLKIYKKITPNSNDEFVKADSEYYWILSLLPQSRPGSVWGTDGGGIGALSAMNNGLFVMNKSGGNKLVLRKLEELSNGRL